MITKTKTPLAIAVDRGLQYLAAARHEPVAKLHACYRSNPAICCIVCSGVSERRLMAAEGEAKGEGIVICPHCLAEGDIDAKLERHAARLESRSRWLRAVIGRLEVPSQAVLKEFAGPEDTEQAAVFWDSLNDLLDESDLPLSRAAHRLASLLQEYRGAWPLIKSDAEADPERGKALAAALAKRREFFGPGADL